MVSRADVARLAGVSQSTVSYALNGSRPVTAQTRQRIEDAIRTLGYTPNAMARGLVLGRSRLLAMQLPVTERGLHLTEMEYIESASVYARSQGYHLLVWIMPAGDLEEFRRAVRERLVEGVLLMEVAAADPRVPILRELGVPFALIGRTGADEDHDYVDADFASVGDAVVRQLADLGHRRLAFISQSEALVRAGYGPTVRSEASVLDAARAAAMAVDVLHIPATLRDGWSSFGRLLDDDPGITALVSINEQATIGALEAARERSRRVPDDLSVVAVGLAAASAEMVVPALTTIGPSPTELSRLGVQALLRRIGDPTGTPTGQVVPVHLTERESTAPAPRTAAPA